MRMSRCQNSQALFDYQNIQAMPDSTDATARDEVDRRRVEELGLYLISPNAHFDGESRWTFYHVYDELINHPEARMAQLRCYQGDSTLINELTNRVAFRLAAQILGLDADRLGFKK